MESGLVCFNNFVSLRTAELSFEINSANYHELRLIATYEWNVFNGKPLKFEQVYTMECLKVYRGQDFYSTVENFENIENANACFNTVKRWKMNELKLLKKRIYTLIKFEEIIYKLL